MALNTEEEDELIERVEKALTTTTVTRIRDRVYFEDGTFEDILGPLIRLDELKQET
jgi:hypothetical protein